MAKADYEDLVDVWWKTAAALEATSGAEQARITWHAHVFGRILEQCGWSVREWNEIVAEDKKKD